MGQHLPRTGTAAIDAILYAAHRVRTEADARLRSHGLSLSSYKVLRTLERESVSMRELSEALSVAARSMTDLVDGLQRRGFVTRSAHPTDRRVSLVALTDAGRQEVRRAALVAEATHREAIGELDEAEQATLVALLARVHPGDQPLAGASVSITRASASTNSARGIAGASST